MTRNTKPIWQDDSGATIVEFAMVAPVLMVALLGLFDMSYNIYTKTLLDGAILGAARSSTIQGASGAQAEIDAKVTDAVKTIVPTATIAIQRKSYTNFADVNRPEDFTDRNGDGICNNGEPFEDVNGNSIWDSDRSRQGFGGARDAVLYSVTVTYDRAFPMHNLIGLPDKVELQSQTVLRNQPFDTQDVQVTVGNC